ncbi:BON domain-containing protein [Gloeobacter violaceus]|uniref:Gll3284 protein n=1 Tax=Gloeobacter violaceus (strain ATCC 29082 / PCC 7421) TaxID=251221 RepID=Q7NG89_GLOVI|nr:BON domain-containing protein [Gloeobacter violaceus]BAC91225.1 gll3284 [Gloeobacter violaceus PCC 7421]
MRALSDVSRFGILAVALMLLISCAPGSESRESAERSLEYAERSVEAAGQAIREQTREATESVDRNIDQTGRNLQRTAGDTAIVTKVKGILAADPLVQSFAIDVQSSEGVVTLRGEVKNDAQRRRALEDAQSVKGVVQVVDQLTLKN